MMVFIDPGRHSHLVRVLKQGGKRGRVLSFRGRIYLHPVHFPVQHIVYNNVAF